jgi:predicted Zn-dependent protease
MPPTPTSNPASPLSVLTRSNTFVTYEGSRQKDGSILAKKVEFTENELNTGEARLWKMLSPKIKTPNYVSSRPGQLQIQRVGKFKLTPNEEVQKYVQELGMSLVPKWQRDLPPGDPQKIPFHFFVVDEKVPNAFALAIGTVVLNSGMLTMLENEAQLAAVLGHEIAHAIQEHTYRQSQYHKKALMALRIGAAVGAAYGGRAVADLANLAEAAIRNGYTRSLENQADRVGTEYMMTAGYDPREAPRVWKVMALRNGDHPTNFFWSTHDNHTTRRSYLMAELKNNYSGVDFESYRRDDPRFAKAADALNAQHAPKKKVKVKY